MKRDYDYLRELLLRYESDPDPIIIPPGDASEDTTKELHHLNLLSDKGFVTHVGKYSYRLTNSGHDFLEAMRDEGIWQRTKQVVAESGGNATLDIIKQLAVGFLKKKIRDHTEIEF